MFSNRRQDVKATIFDLKHGGADIALVVTRLDPMQTFDDDFVHFIRDRMRTIAGKAVNTCSHQKMCSKLLGRAEEFIDVAFAIPDVNAAIGRFKEHRGLLQIL